MLWIRSLAASSFNNLTSTLNSAVTFVRLNVFTSPFCTQAAPLPTYMGLLKSVRSLLENCCDQFQTGGKYTTWSSPCGMALFLAKSCRIKSRAKGPPFDVHYILLFSAYYLTHTKRNDSLQQEMRPQNHAASPSPGVMFFFSPLLDHWHIFIFTF